MRRTLIRDHLEREACDAARVSALVSNEVSLGVQRGLQYRDRIRSLHDTLEHECLFKALLSERATFSKLSFPGPVRLVHFNLYLTALRCSTGPTFPKSQPPGVPPAPALACRCST